MMDLLINQKPSVRSFLRRIHVFATSAKKMLVYLLQEMRGLIVATGDYITFIDPDDWVTEDYIEILYNQLKKYEARHLHWKL